MDFQETRGLRQGKNPISPFLFTIVAEGIVGLFKNARSMLSFHPFKLSDNLEFDLLQFVNDAIIVG